MGVVGRLKSDDLRPVFEAENRALQDKLRREHQAKRSARPLLALEEARHRRPRLDWDTYEIPTPSFTGVRAVEVPLADIVPYIDWSPFFTTWELKGTYPRIFENPDWGSKAKELFADAQELLSRIVDQKLLQARAVYGFFPANSVGDEIEVYSDARRSGLLTTLHTLRQQADMGEKEPNQALADFIAPLDTGRIDYLGAFAVTTGHGIEALVAAFDADHDDYGSIMAKALADRLAEALAELLHKRVREEWGYGRGENLSVEELIRERYRGIRPAPGYPACPDHTEKRLLFDLLGAETAAGIHLTESFAMMPASSVSGFYFAHPKARYFTVGRIGKDQVLDYHRRKGIELRTMERWLAPNLEYEPSEEPATVLG